MVVERNFHKTWFKWFQIPETLLIDNATVVVSRREKKNNTIGGTRAERRGLGRMVSTGTRFIVIAVASLNNCYGARPRHGL